MRNPSGSQKARGALSGSRTSAATALPACEHAADDLAAGAAGGAEHRRGHRVSRSAKLDQLRRQPPLLAAGPLSRGQPAASKYLATAE